MPYCIARRILPLTLLCLCLFSISPVHADQKSRARADRLLERSVPLYNAKNYKGALELCRQAILSDPTYARSFVGLGRCQEKLNQRKAACAAYRQALILSPEARDKQNALEGLKRLGCSVAPPPRPGPKPLEPLPTPSKVISVSAQGDGDYSTISEAVEAAPAYARLMIRPGRYEESIVLTKPLQIVGDGLRPGIIIAGIDKPALIIQAENCFLRGLTFKAYSVKDASFSAVEVRSGDGVFEECEVGAQSHSGMQISSGATADLRQVRFVGARTSNLVFASNSAGQVEDCDIFGAKVTGVEVGTGANPSFLRTKIHHNKAKGVLVHERGRGSFVDCYMTHNAFAGFEVKRGGVPFMQRCGITNNYIGLYLWPGSNPRMINCSLRNNTKIDRQRKAGV